ncbi:galactose-specific lectin nattectin-like [Menidia menidia]
MASGSYLVFFGFVISVLIANSYQKEADEEALPGCSLNCPPGWTQFGSRCFIFHYTSKTWIDAENHCLSIGGNLASIHSAEENNFLSDLILRVTGRRHVTWIGGSDAVAEKTWLWSDGSQADYFNWFKEQPNNYGGKEHCLEIYLGGTFWNDRPCDVKTHFLCAKKL